MGNDMEMRWLEKEVAVNESLSKLERVLQFREYDSRGWWGDWKDVPTEKEG